MSRSSRGVVLLGLLLLSGAALLLGGAVTAAQAAVTIDGVLAPGEWDGHYLGTVVTQNSAGELRVDVYAFIEGGYLYYAFAADTTSPGWAYVEQWNRPLSLDFKTLYDSGLYQPGSTNFDFSGDPPQCIHGIGPDPDTGQNRDWVSLGSLSDNGVEYWYVRPGSGHEKDNVVELKIPLSLLEYAGQNGMWLRGQYWSDDLLPEPWGAWFALDNTPPVVTPPPGVTAEEDETSPDGTYVDIGWATATDDWDPNPYISNDSPWHFPVGETIVTWTATDASGNSATAEQTVTVVPSTTPPVITCPADITAEQTQPGGAVVTFECTATDSGGADVPVTCSPASGSPFPLGTTTVTCTAVDDSGNTAEDSFTVTVVDTTPPTIRSVTATPNVLWPANHKMVAVAVSVSATDNSGAAPTCRIVSVSSNEPVSGLGDGDTAPDWGITGDLTLNLRAERSSAGSGRVYTITVEARDAAGNASTATCTVSVPHDKGKK